ncbi:MAG TPA: hypothetical protein VGV60_16350 [Candidatus Polarisedimenticolia bacterium]|nr:hypothetical protein [Candidatus Polarisedimenticolia bacterium]
MIAPRPGSLSEYSAGSRSGRRRAGCEAPRRVTGALVAAGLVVVLAAGAGRAFAYVQSNLVDVGFGDLGLFQAGSAMTLRLEQDASFRITDGSDLTALVASMASWTAIPTSNITITDGARFNLASPIDAAAGQSNDGVNRLYFAETDNTNLIGNAIAISFFFVGGDGRIIDCDIIMNERLYTFSTSTPANPNQSLGSGTFDMGEIATHEMGHCIGLEHSAVAGRFGTSGLEVSGFSSGDFTYQATMYPYGTHTIQGRSLSQDDIAGASFIYPNSTLTSTTGTISGRVLNGATFDKVKGAHVVAVSTAAPDVPVVGVISDVQAGGPGGEYKIVGLPPGSYYVRIEPLAGGTNPFTQVNTHFTGFDTTFPWEFYDGPTESGFDVATDRVAVSVAAGQTVSGIDFLTNVATPDPNEPNNTRASATPIACEQAVVSSIVPRGDVDYYALSVTSGTTVVADVNAARSGSPLDPIVGVFDAAGNLVAFVDNSISFDPILAVDLFTPGTYYVAVASFNDVGFNGTDARTVGDYRMTLHCSVPEVRAGTCLGRVLYAASDTLGAVYALSDVDRDLSFEGQTEFVSGAGSGLGQLNSRRDGGVCVGTTGSNIIGLWDDNGDFTADRSLLINTSAPDARVAAAARRGGVEYLYTAGQLGTGTVYEERDTGGDAKADQTTVFTEDPQSDLALSMDETGTLYVLDWMHDDMGGILAYRDLDGDGDADVSSEFLAGAASYGNMMARRPGEVFALNIWLGQVERLLDADGDGIADEITVFATGLALDFYSGMAVDDADVLYVVDAGNRVVALPDDDNDGIADRLAPFSPQIPGLRGITFGQGPPGTVSLPGSFHPVTVAQSGSSLRLTWEDLGPTVPAYNIYEGTIGSWYSHAPLLCRVTGTTDGAGNRFLDVMPTGTADRYYLITASDACGEGSPGRAGSGLRRPMPNGTCGAAP